MDPHDSAQCKVKAAGPNVTLDVAGMRQQILANAEALYPYLMKGSSAPPDHAVAQPKFDLITSGFCSSICAYVMFSMPNTGMMASHKTLLIAGPSESNIYEALEGLLVLTHNVMTEMFKSCRIFPTGAELVKVEGDGVYYKKP